jgi:hypothetical protein
MRARGGKSLQIILQILLNLTLVCLCVFHAPHCFCFPYFLLSTQISTDSTLIFSDSRIHLMHPRSLVLVLVLDTLELISTRILYKITKSLLIFTIYLLTYSHPRPSVFSSSNVCMYVPTLRMGFLSSCLVIYFLFSSIKGSPDPHQM